MSTAQETTTLEKIRSRGYWQVVIRPSEFVERRVPRNADLFPIVEKNSVQYMRWDYPHVDRSRRPLWGDGWVGQESDREDRIEVWRIHLSGLFHHVFAIHEDWRDHSRLWPAGPDWAPNREIQFVHTLHTFSEIFEFAARLALSFAGGAHMVVEIDMEGLKGRCLTTRNIEVVLTAGRCTQAPRWKHRWSGTQTELIARPRELSAEAARKFLDCFGLDFALETFDRFLEVIPR